MPDIILSSLNARYIHASLGLRYLKANMGELKNTTQLIEFTINQQIETIVEAILQHQPKIVGFGIYIWNIEQTHHVIAQLKTIKPELIIVIGGPEVSYEYENQSIVSLADYLITGSADIAFSILCRQLLDGQRPQRKIIHAKLESLQTLALPYDLYSDEDINYRVLYVEASRGCPFKCEFCLSALDKTMWPFDLDLFLNEIQKLYDRGARHYKFVDRTFNLKVQSSVKILEFFLEKLNETELFLHFELVPDRLPNALRVILQKFPQGSLQFEIGVQTLNNTIQDLISRRQDNEKTKENIQWIRNNTNAYIHADLIFALPGESINSFAHGFDELYKLNPHEIQLGILKRLRGTPIDQHSEFYCMRFNPFPPYNILSTKHIDFPSMQRFSRFARYWDLIANSGRFTQSTKLMLKSNPYQSFYKVTESIYSQCGQTHQIALKRLYTYLYIAMVEALHIEADRVERVIKTDYDNSGLKGWFIPPSERTAPQRIKTINIQSRQNRHQTSTPTIEAIDTQHEI